MSLQDVEMTPCAPWEAECEVVGWSGVFPTSEWFKAVEEAGMRPWGVHEDGYYPDGMQRMAYRVGGVELYKFKGRFCNYSWFGLRCQIPRYLGTVE